MREINQKMNVLFGDTFLRKTNLTYPRNTRCWWLPNSRHMASILMVLPRKSAPRRQMAATKIAASPPKSCPKATSHGGHMAISAPFGLHLALSIKPSRHHTAMGPPLGEVFIATSYGNRHMVMSLGHHIGATWRSRVTRELPIWVCVCLCFFTSCILI